MSYNFKKPKTLVVGVPAAKGDLSGTGGNYVAKMEKLVAEGKIPRGKVSDVEIRHDSFCGIYDSKPCNCNPDILLDGKKIA
jgi:hypothetical protein